MLCIIIIIIIISFMQGIYTYTPEANHVPREYSIAAVLPIIIIIVIIIIVISLFGGGGGRPYYRSTYSVYIHFLNL
jgi:hypothetical protein